MTRCCCIFYFLMTKDESIINSQQRRLQFNSIQFYLYSAFYNTGLSQSSFTKGPGLRPLNQHRLDLLTQRNLLSNKTVDPQCCAGNIYILNVNRAYTYRRALKRNTWLPPQNMISNRPTKASRISEDWLKRGFFMLPY